MIKNKNDLSFEKLQSKEREILSEKEEFFIKRKAMKKQYYNEILNLLDMQKFKEAASKYFELAITISERKDFRTSSLLILLHGLCLLKLKKIHITDSLAYVPIVKNIYDFLNSLDITKIEVRDNFYIMLIFFIVNVQIYSIDKYIPNIKGMLEILPLFEEEVQLIDIPWQAQLKEELSKQELIERVREMERRVQQKIERTSIFYETCGGLIRGEYPQIDGEIFKLCSECFNILKGVVQQIEDIFDSN